MSTYFFSDYPHNVGFRSSLWISQLKDYHIYKPSMKKKIRFESGLGLRNYYSFSNRSNITSQALVLHACIELWVLSALKDLCHYHLIYQGNQRETLVYTFITMCAFIILPRRNCTLKLLELELEEDE